MICIGWGTIYLRSLVAPTVRTSVWSIAWSRILSVNTNFLCLLPERQEAVVVLEQNGTLSRNLSGEDMVIFHNIDMLVDDAVWWVPRSLVDPAGAVFGPRAKTGLWEALILPKMIPSSDNTSCHVIQAIIWQRTVNNGAGKLGTPKWVTIVPPISVACLTLGFLRKKGSTGIQLAPAITDLAIPDPLLYRTR